MWGEHKHGENEGDNCMTQPIFFDWKKISSLLNKIDIHEPMKNAFIEYSNGNAEIPPVGELIFEEPPGEVHIKYGCFHVFS